MLRNTREGGLPPLPPATYNRAMAIYHLSAKIIGRKAGQSSVACAAYRSGEELSDDRTGQTFRFARSDRVVHAEVIAPRDAPAWALSRSDLWNAVEAREKRKDSQLAREFEVALPRELDLDQQLALVRGWIAAEFTGAGAVADVAIHYDRAGNNPHAHILTTMRAVHSEGWAQQKLRQWEDRAVLAHWRKSWADHVNVGLERHGATERVDHRSYAAQDAELPVELRRVPTSKVGLWGADRDRDTKNKSIIARNIEKLRLIADRALSRRSVAKGPRVPEAPQESKQKPEATPDPVLTPPQSGGGGMITEFFERRRQTKQDKIKKQELQRAHLAEQQALILSQWEEALLADPALFKDRIDERRDIFEGEERFSYCIDVRRSGLPMPDQSQLQDVWRIAIRAQELHQAQQLQRKTAQKSGSQLSSLERATSPLGDPTHAAWLQDKGQSR